MCVSYYAQWKKWPYLVRGQERNSDVCTVAVVRLELQSCDIAASLKRKLSNFGTVTSDLFARSKWYGIKFQSALNGLALLRIVWEKITFATDRQQDASGI